MSMYVRLYMYMYAYNGQRTTSDVIHQAQSTFYLFICLFVDIGYLSDL